MLPLLCSQCKLIIRSRTSARDTASSAVIARGAASPLAARDPKSIRDILERLDRPSKGVFAALAGHDTHAYSFFHRPISKKPSGTTRDISSRDDIDIILSRGDDHSDQDRRDFLDGSKAGLSFREPSDVPSTHTGSRRPSPQKSRLDGSDGSRDPLGRPVGGRSVGDRRALVIRLFEHLAELTSGDSEDDTHTSRAPLSQGDNLVNRFRFVERDGLADDVENEQQ